MADVRDFLMPDLGEGLTEGEIISWLVAEGDTVSVDQPIAEVSTEKAVVEVPTPFAGRVVTLHGNPGDMIAVGAPLISIEVGEPGATSGSGNVLVGYGPSESPVERRQRVSAAAATSGPAPAASATVAAPASPLV